MKRKRLIIIFVALIVIAVIIWQVAGSGSSTSSPDISGSGFIEARDIAVSLEIGGRIVEITADEGAIVAAGMPLVKLDDSLLLAQKRQAEANLKLAQANLEQARISRDGAEKVWQNTLDVQANPLELEAGIIAAEGELAMAELNLQREREIESDFRVPAAQVRRDTAEKVLQNLEDYQALGLVSQYFINKEILPAEGELATAELNLTYLKELESLWSPAVCRTAPRYRQSSPGKPPGHQGQSAGDKCRGSPG